MKRPEDNLQRAIVDYIRLVAPSPRYLLFSIPNAAKRSQSEMWMLHWTGFITGMFDLCLVGPGGQAHFIETKLKGNKLTDKQEGIKECFIRMGVPHVVAYSLDDVKAALAHWKIIPAEQAARHVAA